MLQQEALKKLFRPAMRFGLRDKGTWTYVIEQEFFDPLLLELVKRGRRKQRDDKETAIFLGNARRRTLKVRLEMWKRMLGRRNRCRMLMLEIGGRLCTAQTSVGFRLIR
ncbi:unnamed protein product, partial [Sphacelaria rigidula]